MKKTAPGGFAAKAAVAFRATAKFLSQDVWDVELSAVRGARRALLRTLRVLFLAASGFRRDECVLRASSLTFMTLLSIVPVLALSLSVCKGVMDESELRGWTAAKIHSAFQNYFPEAASSDAPPAQAVSFSPGTATAFPAPERPGADAPGAKPAPERPGADAPGAKPAPLEGVPSVSSVPSVPLAPSPSPPAPSARGLDESFFQDLASKAFDVVAGLNFRALGGFGLLLLVWTVVSLIANVEKAFNRVWGVKENRPLMRKFTDYLSVIVILPVLSIAASSVPIVATLQSKVDALDGGFSRFFAGLPVFKALWVLLLLTISFSFLLRFTPNTRVRLVPGLLGGLVAAVGFSGWLKICLGLQIGVAKYSGFFGSFAAVPILLFWGYVSWVIILVACEVSFAAQNADTYQMERGWERPSPRARLLLAAALVRELAESVRAGDGILDVVDFQRRHHVPVRFVRDVVSGLVAAGVLAPVAGRDEAFVSRVDLQSWTVSDLTSALLRAGEPSPSALGLDGIASARALAEWLDRMGDGAPLLRDLPGDAPAGAASGLSS